MLPVVIVLNSREFKRALRCMPFIELTERYLSESDGSWVVCDCFELGQFELQRQAARALPISLNLNYRF